MGINASAGKVFGWLANMARTSSASMGRLASYIYIYKALMMSCFQAAIAGSMTWFGIRFAYIRFNRGLKVPKASDRSSFSLYVHAQPIRRLSSASSAVRTPQHLWPTICRFFGPVPDLVHRGQVCEAEEIWTSSLVLPRSRLTRICSLVHTLGLFERGRTWGSPIGTRSRHHRETRLKTFWGAWWM